MQYAVLQPTVNLRSHVCISYCTHIQCPRPVCFERADQLCCTTWSDLRTRCTLPSCNVRTPTTSSPMTHDTSVDKLLYRNHHPVPPASRRRMLTSSCRCNCSRASRITYSCRFRVKRIIIAHAGSAFQSCPSAISIH